MRQVFNKVKAECAVCGTPLDGENILKRDGKYYCPSDFDITSHEEKADAALKRKQYQAYKRLF